MDTGEQVWPPKPGAAKRSAPESARDAGAAAVRADSKLDQLKTTVDEMTPENLPETKPQAQTLVVLTKQDVAEVIVAALRTERAAEKDQQVKAGQQKKIEQLEADDPVRTWLRWGAVGLFGLGGLFVVLALWRKSRDLAIAAGAILALGGCYYAIASLLTLFKWVFGAAVIATIIAALIVAGWLAWRYYATHLRARKVIRSIDTAHDAGLIEWNDRADALLSTLQGPDGKALVDAMQASTG